MQWHRTVQIGHCSAGKNGTDIRLAGDATEILITRPTVEPFVLVTRDSDVPLLASKLREFGKHITAVG